MSLVLGIYNQLEDVCIQMYEFKNVVYNCADENVPWYTMIDKTYFQNSRISYSKNNTMNIEIFRNTFRFIYDDWREKYSNLDTRTLEPR